MENQSKKMVQIVYDALDEKLGEDIEILKVDEISIIADYLVIANGRNQNQLNAMTDLVEEKMIEAGESFMPSPIIMTHLPFSVSLSINFALSSGKTSE